ncbi:MAG: pyridoxamine 5'-phosphate oxidase family protein [Candidatus Omnitrophica bacterium]|nr:pyridoxamine 5'-phosphate oxidase family protein [Candidatus Omnitrophota bacterium]
MIIPVELPEEVLKFFTKQGAVIISTIDAKRRIHCSVKGLVRIEKQGKAFVVDLYSGKTYRNLLKNSKVSITAVDEERFIGYTLQGRAKIVPKSDISEKIIQDWESRIAQRISKRIVNSIHRGHTAKRHFEVHLPNTPRHLIEVEVESVIDLSPPHTNGSKPDKE